MFSGARSPPRLLSRAGSREGRGETVIGLSVGANLVLGGHAASGDPGAKCWRFEGCIYPLHSSVEELEFCLQCIVFNLAQTDSIASQRELGCALLDQDAP